MCLDPPMVPAVWSGEPVAGPPPMDPAPMDPAARVAG